ncbi:hypothetical protein C8R48DRAFT_771269 [Suillus tomentosus]|nr:hypothetical protein C8R48DRAFT_771269 [Suillus tomentosus]
MSHFSRINSANPRKRRADDTSTSLSSMAEERRKRKRLAVLPAELPFRTYKPWAKTTGFTLSLCGEPFLQVKTTRREPRVLVSRPPRVCCFALTFCGERFLQVRLPLFLPPLESSPEPESPLFTPAASPEREVSPAFI